MIHLLYSEKKGISYLNKPEKIYLSDTNLLEALSTTGPEIGTLRETLFLNQLSAVADVRMHNHTDFMVNNTYAFEIGGKNKTGHQIKNLPNAYIVADDIETGFHNKIPLWLFGLLY